MSTTNKDSDAYEQEITHRHFTFIEASKDSCVVTCVNKKWAHLSPKSATGLITHNNVQCIELSEKDGTTFRIINIYNDSKTNAGLDYLEQQVDHLPQIHVLAGDFNLHHPLWENLHDGSRLRSSLAKADTLIDIATVSLDLDLQNDPIQATWSSNNPNVQDSVLDLVWTHPSVHHVKPIQLRRVERFNSDHTPIFIYTGLDVEETIRTTVKQGSENGEKFIREIRAGLAFTLHHDSSDYTSAEMLEHYGKSISETFSSAWNRHAEECKPSSHSKPWWNRACTVAAKKMVAVKERY